MKMKFAQLFLGHFGGGVHHQVLREHLARIESRHEESGLEESDDRLREFGLLEVFLPALIVGEWRVDRLDRRREESQKQGDEKDLFHGEGRLPKRVRGKDVKGS